MNDFFDFKRRRVFCFLSFRVYLKEWLWTFKHMLGYVFNPTHSNSQDVGAGNLLGF